MIGACPTERTLCASTLGVLRTPGVHVWVSVYARPFFCPTGTVVLGLACCRPNKSVLRSALLIVLVTVGLAACAPRLSPPYRDFEARGALAQADSLGPLPERLVEAVKASGWTVGVPQAAGIVTTEARQFSHGFFGETTAVLDLVPLDGGFVRVYVRAESKGLLGGRTKVYALNGELRQIILGPISDALAERRLVPLGTPIDRDEEATR